MFNKNHRFSYINVLKCTILLYSRLNTQINLHLCHKSTSLNNYTIIMPKFVFEILEKLDTLCHKSTSLNNQNMSKFVFEIGIPTCLDLVDVNFHINHAETEKHIYMYSAFFWVYLNIHTCTFLFKIFPLWNFKFI